jgi:thiol-disulfide isomerase/thioredoxin
MSSALAAIDGASEWLNSEPLTAERLGGEVVLVDFWTYSCVNWLRTLPYLRAWDERYRDRGLTILGVHAPEFGFEHELGNVRTATAEFGIAYPVVIDNEFAIWRSFDNHYWPAIYIVGRDGRIAFDHFGEGAYEDTEQAIQRLLGDEGQLSAVDAAGLSEAADLEGLGSPETYLGLARGERRSDAPAQALGLNEWRLDGAWSARGESADLQSAPGSITYRFQARDVNLVMAPGAEGPAVRFAVTLDGAAPGADGGLDVDEAGAGTLDEPRMYQLLRLRDPGRHTFEVSFLDPGVRAYVFTFG